MVHELKTHPPYFDEVESGEKSFELRKNDRMFSTGDILILREYEPLAQAYTGRRCQKEVVYLLECCPDFGLMEGYCIMGLSSNNSIIDNTIYSS